MAKGAVYPVFLRLEGVPVLVVGGGGVGLRKARGLEEGGARVVVVSEAFEPELKRLKGVKRVREGYRTAHMRREKWRLVFAATDVAAVNKRVQRDAAARGILCCRCDEPELGEVSGGAVERVGRGEEVTIAVSTRGASPYLGARICKAAAEGLDTALVSLAELAPGWRKRVKGALGDIAARRALLMRIVGPEMEGRLRAGGSAEAKRAFETWLKECCAAAPKRDMGKMPMPRRKGAARGG